MVKGRHLEMHFVLNLVPSRHSPTLPLAQLRRLIAYEAPLIWPLCHHAAPLVNKDLVRQGCVKTS
jgi:hypothetical protein